MKKTNNEKHGIPALLSAIFPGLGQIVKGEVGKGIIIMVLMVLNFLSIFILIGIITCPIVWCWQVYDAYNN